MGHASRINFSLILKPLTTFRKNSKRALAMVKEIYFSEAKGPCLIFNYFIMLYRVTVYDKTGKFIKRFVFYHERHRAVTYAKRLAKQGYATIVEEV